MLATDMGPATVPPPRVTVAPLTVVMTLPAPVAEKLALLMVLPLSNCTCEPLRASMLPPLLLTTTLPNCRVPPSARITPLLVSPALVSTSSGAPDVAMTVPLLAIASAVLVPNCPAPCRVTPFASVSASPLALAAYRRLFW
ncbi:MAG: hypothetical protein IPL57_00960 [Rubrivivax sp.]|nr:hypothetical protein [Rubrivivax sp.]